MNLIEMALQNLGITQADVECGFKDVDVRSFRGDTYTVRVSKPASVLIPRVFGLYAQTQDARVLLRAVLSKEHANGAFLASLLPGDIAKLANVAVGLCVGPDTLKQIACSGIKSIEVETESEHARN